MKGKTEEEIKIHLATEYSPESGHEYGEPHDETVKMLRAYKILLAYESVGSWGCDSSSFFILKNKSTGILYEIHGSHCSCYGFEGQLQLEETTSEALKTWVNNEGYFVGGYDSDEENNKLAVKNFIQSLK